MDVKDRGSGIRDRGSVKYDTNAQCPMRDARSERYTVFNVLEF